MSKIRVFTFVAIQFCLLLAVFHEEPWIAAAAEVAVLGVTYVWLSRTERPPAIFQSSSQNSLRLTCRRVLGIILRFFFPKYGFCYRCFCPWVLTRHHTTQLLDLGTEYTNKNAVFAMCETCFRQQTAEERLRYYGFMYADMVTLHGLERHFEDWDHIKASVLAEDIPEQQDEWPRAA